MSFITNQRMRGTNTFPAVENDFHFLRLWEAGRHAQVHMYARARVCARARTCWLTLFPAAGLSRFSFLSVIWLPTRDHLREALGSLWYFSSGLAWGIPFTDNGAISVDFTGILGTRE